MTTQSSQPSSENTKKSRNIGVEKWSKEFDTKRKDLWVFKNNKILPANVVPNLIQQLKNIDEY